MKRKCIDTECGKTFVISKSERRAMKEVAPYPGDENLCPKHFDDVVKIAYDQSYFGSIGEWGA